MGAGGRRGDIHIDKGQYGSSEVGLDCQNFFRVIIREYVTIRHLVCDGVVDESDKSTTTASGRAIVPDGGIACEPLEGRVHAEFGLLHTGDQYLVTVKEGLQFCEAVLDAVAIKVNKPATLKGRSWSGGARLGR